MRNLKTKLFKTMVKTFVLAALMVALATCKSLPGIISDPKVEFDSVSITGIDFSGIDMLAKIKIQNDNPITVPFPEINWKLFVSDASFLNGVINKNTKIAAKKTTVVDLPLKVSYDGLFKTVSRLINADEAPYRIEIDAKFALPLLENKTFSKSFSGTIPMLKMPSLSFSGIKFNTISLTKVEFTLTWLIDNKNAFAINLDKLDYGFMINGNSWASGTAPTMNLPAKRATSIPITVNVSGASLIQEIFAMATTGKSASYSCTGETSLTPKIFEDLNIIKPLKIPFNYSGTTPIRR